MFLPSLLQEASNSKIFETRQSRVKQYQELYPGALRATPPPCPFETAFTVCFIYKFRWKFIPESTETSTNNGEQFSEICTTNRWQITPEGTQMSKNRGLGRSWGCVGRVLEPSGPKGPPRCTLGCENHVRGSPFRIVFLRCFLNLLLLLSFRQCIQSGIL